MVEQAKQLSLGLGHVNRPESVGQITMYQLLDLQERRQMALDAKKRAEEEKRRKFEARIKLREDLNKAGRDLADRTMSYVAQDYGLSRDDIIGPSRRGEISEARHIVAHLLYTNTDLSLNSLAKLLGRTNHTTVLNSLDRVRERMVFDADFKERVEEFSAGFAGITS